MEPRVDPFALVDLVHELDQRTAPSAEPGVAERVESSPGGARILLVRVGLIDLAGLRIEDPTIVGRGGPGPAPGDEPAVI